jgi:hypothetical protein
MFEGFWKPDCNGSQWVLRISGESVRSTGTCMREDVKNLIDSNFGLSPKLFIPGWATI